MEREQRGDNDLIAKSNLRRSRINAIVFGIIAGLSLICLVYAFLQQNTLVAERKINSQQMKMANEKIEALASELKKCNEENARHNSNP